MLTRKLSLDYAIYLTEQTITNSISVQRLNIFYDIPSENWYHTEENAELFAGAAVEEISYKKDHLNQPLIPITVFPGNRMLVVGILTASQSQKGIRLGRKLNPFSGPIIIFIEARDSDLCIHRKCPSLRDVERVCFFLHFKQVD